MCTYHFSKKKKGGNGIAEIGGTKKIVAIQIGNWRRERESCLNKKYIIQIFLFFSIFFDSFCVYVMFLHFELLVKS